MKKFVIALLTLAIFGIQDAEACQRNRTVVKVASAPVITTVRVVTAPVRFFSHRSVSRAGTGCNCGQASVAQSVAPTVIIPQAQPCQNCQLPTQKNKK